MSMLSRLKQQRLFGGILLVSGTTIGAGMLALPVISSFAGFFPSLLMLLFCWLLMLITALFLLRVNLSIRGSPNFISMVEKTLGRFGKGISWVVYLALLYSLTAAYIAGSFPFIKQGIFLITGKTLSSSLGYFILPLIFGSFLWFGAQGIDYLNRLLMIGLFVAYALLIAFLPSHMELKRLIPIDFSKMWFTFPIVITSFGYHIIIPTLTTYLDHDAKKLKKAIIIGSLLPIVFYLLWQLLVLASVPADSLQQAWREGVSAAAPVMQLINSPLISIAISLFSFFAIITSFLGVSLSLSDFLSDGLKLKKNWEGKLGAYLLAFVPPLFFLFNFQRAFYTALSYAGVFVSILLILLPTLMIWKLRPSGFYKTWKGKAALCSVIILSLGIIAIDVMTKMGFFIPK